jgi:hypothetical protein
MRFTVWVCESGAFCTIRKRKTETETETDMKASVQQTPFGKLSAFLKLLISVSKRKEEKKIKP